VFDKQSLGSIHCGQMIFQPLRPILLWHPFSRSYGAVLPSSLTRVLPRVLEFSSRLPVSVCGTGTYILDRGFSWQYGISFFTTKNELPITSRYSSTDFTIAASYKFGRIQPKMRSTYPPASPHLSNAYRQFRNINLLSIAYAIRPGLRSRLTLRGRAFLRKP